MHPVVAVRSFWAHFLILSRLFMHELLIASQALSRWQEPHEIVGQIINNMVQAGTGSFQVQIVRSALNLHYFLFFSFEFFFVCCFVFELEFHEFLRFLVSRFCSLSQLGASMEKLDVVFQFTSR